MVPASSRFGLAFALTLLLPGALAATWGWLVHGGVITRALANESAATAQRLETADRLVREQLEAAAGNNSCRLSLDGERRVTGPFADRPPQVPAEIGLAEATANARLIVLDRTGALPFLAHAAENGELSAEGSLAYAGLLAENDRAAAERALQRAETRFADTWCGTLPFDLLAAMQRARWLTAADAAATRTALSTALLAKVRRLPASTVATVLTAMVEAMPELRDDARLAEIGAAATTAVHLAGTAAPATPAKGTHDSVLMPLGVDELAVLTAAVVSDCLLRAQRRTAALHPAYRIELDRFAATAWRAQPKTTPASTLLTYTARSCLGLAMATLVLGNLLLWRLTRREFALVRMRRDFVDVVSHELRTPLTALALKSEMLALGDVPLARRTHYLQSLHNDVNRLTDQVERILDFGRLERGAALSRERVPARDLLARGLRAGRQALRLVEQRLEVEVPRTLPSLDIDLDMLSRALRNLLENAAKYAPAGSTVGVRAFADGSKVIVEVADTGPGVAAEDRRAIFQPFVRASSVPPAIQGSGLGLALVAAAAKAHGGSVDLRQRTGGGAVFTLTLPIAKETAS